MVLYIRALLLSLYLLIYGASEAQQKNIPTEVAKAWWKAFALGDTVFLKKHSAKDASFTLSAGKTFGGEALYFQAAKNNPDAKIALEWITESLQYTDPKTAVARFRVKEAIGANVVTFQYLCVLHSSDSIWKVVAAQSTKELELSPRKPELETAPLHDYAGNYRTPAGAFLKLIVRENKLLLQDPSGAESLLEPVGPGLYELSNLPLVGNVRFSFTRDSSGRVTYLNRIGNLVASFPRVE